MSGVWTYEIRPADPGHRADAPEAHEVVAVYDGRRQRVVGVWSMKHQAEDVAHTLARWGGVQLR